jgi:hypothetical protein
MVIFDPFMLLVVAVLLIPFTFPDVVEVAVIVTGELNMLLATPALLTPITLFEVAEEVIVIGELVRETVPAL